MIEKLVSGGQTGVDRGALDAAQSAEIECGGWCPKGRSAEDGAIDPRYPLDETPSKDAAQRTEWNVRDSDGSLILVGEKTVGGTAHTLRVAERLGRPCRVVELDGEVDPDAIRRWIRDHHIRVLNVAGPRESERPGSYAASQSIVSALLEREQSVGRKRGRWLRAAAAMLAIAVLVPIAYSVLRAEGSAPAVVIRDITVPVEVMRTAEEKRQGLSGRMSLEANSGMLFLYDAPGYYAFWMPDMHFDIDILWLREGKIVDLRTQVPHDPGTPLPTYRPRAPADSVLEVNAGFSASHGWSIGDPVRLRGID